MRFLKKIFFGFWFWLFGWKVKGLPPKDKKYVLIVAPHTSNWDFFVGLAAKHIVYLKSHFLAKDSLFKIPIVSHFLRSIGGYPVNRSKKTNLVDQVVELYQTHEEFVVTITPEGTRSYNPNWKTGFYRIAEKAGVPILMVGFDYDHKTVEFRDLFYLTGDMEKDLESIKSYYRSIKGRHPEKGVK
jgi:1-acyl-sn-glycerol-3-phosphate acyltransferase